MLHLKLSKSTNGLRGLIKVDISILIPTKNEELTIEQFVSWAFEGIEKLGVSGEVILADCSTDKTRELAVGLGAKVIDVPKSGLGFAYSYSRNYVSGKFVILGDADCTYDFREIGEFYSKFIEGYEFVMGSRLKGKIEKNSMPFLHRYFGTPFTTFVLSKLLGLPFSDIHCGMRGITKELLLKLPFNEKGWEYAPEMIIEATKLTNSFVEVPINFYKEPKNRISHFKRGKFAFLAPFKAGLGSLRVTLLHAADSLLKFSGLVSMVIGLTGATVLTFGPVVVGNFRLSLISQFGFVVLFNYGTISYMISRFLGLLYAGDKAAIRNLKNILNFNVISLTLFITTSLSIMYLTYLMVLLNNNHIEFTQLLERNIRYGNILFLVNQLFFVIFIFVLLLNLLDRKINMATQYE